MTIFPFMAPKKLWRILKRSIKDLAAHKVLKLSSSLAFSTIFSLPGLLIIVIWVTNIFLEREVIDGTIYSQVENFIGPQAAKGLQNILHVSLFSGAGKMATIIGIASLVIGATAVFGEIQDSINMIWKLRTKTKKRWVLLKVIINRLLSFSIIVSLGFILLVSLVVNGALDILINHLMQKFPELTVMLVYIINLLITYFVTVFIFALIFKVLPDARVEWKHVRVGAFTTAIFFMAGKFLISFYLGQSTLTSAYGAAGSIIVILFWVYYSSIILYFGAAFTRQFAIEMGSNIYPNKYAVWVKRVEVESNESLKQTPDAKVAAEETKKEEIKEAQKEEIKKAKKEESENETS